MPCRLNDCWMSSCFQAVALAVFVASSSRLGQSSLGAEDQGENVAQRWRLYIGTYTDGQSKGIYCCELDVKTGRLENLRLAAETPSPTFLTLHPTIPRLYAVGKPTRPGEKNVTAFAIDERTGQLAQLNQADSGGKGPTHLVVDPTGRRLLVANYGSGDVGCLGIDADGKLEPTAYVAHHQGSGPNKSRQEGPHAHGVYFDPRGKYVFSPDLGIDKIMIYRLNVESGELEANDPAFAATTPGAGPRHMAFSPDERFVYVITELGNTIEVFRYDAERGGMEPIQKISTLPSGTDPEGTKASEVFLHPSGKFLYGSNRGDESLAVFAVDRESGKLEAIQYQSIGGKCPRYFGIDPTGRWLLCCNQHSDNITIFRIDEQSGKLEPTGFELSVPAAVCIVMRPLNEK